MKAKVFIFGTLFLIGNITLSAEQVVREGINLSGESSKSRIGQGIRGELEKILSERGLENATASSLTQQAFEDNDFLTMIQMQNYLNAVESVEYDALLNQIATQLLFEKKIDFSSYDTLVSITQSLHKSRINPELLDRLSHVALINQSLKTA